MSALSQEHVRTCAIGNSNHSFRPNCSWHTHQAYIPLRPRQSLKTAFTSVLPPFTIEGSYTARPRDERTEGKKRQRKGGEWRRRGRTFGARTRIIITPVQREGVDAQLRILPRRRQGWASLLGGVGGGGIAHPES
jgi:hypothetical protein